MCVWVCLCVSVLGTFARECILWLDKILQHLRNPGMSRFPCNYQQTLMFQPWFHFVGSRISQPSSVSESQQRCPVIPLLRKHFNSTAGWAVACHVFEPPNINRATLKPYCGWTKSCTTLKPWETIVCWYLQGNHHARVS